MSLFARFKATLAKTHNALTRQMRQLISAGVEIDEETYEAMEEILIAADVGPEIALQLVDALRERVARDVPPDQDTVMRWLAEEVLAMIGSQRAEWNVAPGRLNVVMMVGVNGTGKTTSTAKLAHFHQQQGMKPLLAAADTFRAAATEQLQIWADRLGVDIVRQGHGADPAAVAYDAIQAGLARGKDLVIIDTAGRLHNQVHLMEELRKIHRVCARALPGAPHEVLLVIDASTGQNGLAQAKQFAAAVDVTGIALVKLDGTAKGGVVLSIQQQLGIPVKWVGIGEQVDDWEPFDPEQFVNALFDTQVSL